MMCQFFSFITEPENNGGKRFFFDWNCRKENLKLDIYDSHSSIAKHYNLNEDKCNKYEYKPILKVFKVDQINSSIDDRIQAQEWVERLDFKKIIEPLNVKPISKPLEITKQEPTELDIQLLKQWASVRDSVGDSVWVSVGDAVGASVRNAVWDSVGDAVWDSVGDAVWDSVCASVRASVGASVRDSVRASVRASVGAYCSTFFDIEYEQDYSSCVQLFERGFVPTFDGTTWRLHSGKNADIVYEWKPEVK